MPALSTCSCVPFMWTEGLESSRFHRTPVTPIQALELFLKTEHGPCLPARPEPVPPLPHRLADGHPALFLSRTRSGDGRVEGMNGWSLAFIVKHYAKLAGLKHFSPHRWRHSAITAYLVASNGDVLGAQKLSRHSKLETLMIYDDAREDPRGRATRLL